MGTISRRKLLTTACWPPRAPQGSSGCEARRLLWTDPPDSVSFSHGRNPDYAAHRLFGRHALAREFAQSQIRKTVCKPRLTLAQSSNG